MSTDGKGADVDPANEPFAVTRASPGVVICGLPNGTLFPVLERLRQAGWVERYWEQDETAEAEGRPRRRYYKITSKGADLAPHALAATTATAPATDAAGAPRPGLAGGVR